MPVHAFAFVASQPLQASSLKLPGSPPSEQRCSLQIYNQTAIALTLAAKSSTRAPSAQSNPKLRPQTQTTTRSYRADILSNTSPHPHLHAKTRHDTTIPEPPPRRSLTALHQCNVSSLLTHCQHLRRSWAPEHVDNRFGAAPQQWISQQFRRLLAAPHPRAQGSSVRQQTLFDNLWDLEMARLTPVPICILYKCIKFESGLIFPSSPARAQPIYHPTKICPRPPCATTNII